MVSCCNPLYLDSVRNLYGRMVPVSCRHCLSCRVDAITSWTYRLQAEYIKKPSAFVTLTYDDNHLYYPHSDLIDSVYSKSSCHLSRHDFALNFGFRPSLNYEHYTKYVDDLRHYIKRLPPDFVGFNRIDKDFRYVCASEYGDSFNRPHAHFLFLGLDFSDCAGIFKKFWKYGSVKVLPVLTGGIRYVLKYFEKNQDDEFKDSMYFDNGLLPPKITFSKGIGKEWFYSHYDEISKTGMIRNGSRFIPVPSYFSNMFARYDSDYVYNRFKNIDRSFENLKVKSIEAGYSSVDKFIKDSARNREVNLLIKSRDSGTACYDYMSPFKVSRLSVKDMQDIVTLAMYEEFAPF